MRLQSAIFTLGDTLFTPDGAAREGLDKTLSLFKMVRRARTSLHRHGAKTRVLRVLDRRKRAGKDDRIVLLRVQALHRALEHRAAVRLADRDGFLNLYFCSSFFTKQCVKPPSFRSFCECIRKFIQNRAA